MSSIESYATTISTTPSDSPSPSTALPHTYPPVPAPTPLSSSTSVAGHESPFQLLMLFSLQHHPLHRHGAEILHLDTRAIATLSPGQIIRLGDGNLYRLEEVQKVSRKWVVFRCDACNELGESVERRTSVLFAVEPRFVKRTFWGRLGRAWFEARPNFLCIR
jgi:hypothetical protein